MSYDVIIKNANTLEQTGVDIAIKDGKIVAIETGITAEAGETIDAAGKFVSAPFVDAHFHLDSVWTRVPNQSGTLKEGIDNWLAYKTTKLTTQDVVERATAYCEHAFSQGIQAIRSHVDVCDPNFRTVEGLLEVRGAMKDKMDIQLVAFPQDGYLRDPNSVKAVERALDAGVDVVGGIPHYERTMEDGAESIKQLMKIAADRGLLVDMHCDETDDPASRHVEMLTAETVRHGLQGRVTASHVTSMAVQPEFYLERKLLGLMREAEINVIVNPLINVHLGGHFNWPQHTGMAPIKKLAKFGIPFACAQDCNEDPWYPIGNADMFETAKMGAHLGHMMGLDDFPTMFDSVTATPAKIMHLGGYGLTAVNPANMVIFDAPDAFNAMRTSAARLHVIREGKSYSKV